MQISKAFVTYGIRRWGTRLQSALPSNCGRRATLTAMRRASSFVSATKWSPVECMRPAGHTPGARGLTSRERPQKPAPGGASATWDTARGSCGAVCPVWAWEAISADSGNRPHALLLAREVAVDVARPVGAARTPGIGSRRLRRCHVSRAH